jgi:hypothetical protein
MPRLPDAGDYRRMAGDFDRAAESAKKLREAMGPEQFDRARAAAERYGASLNGLAQGSRLLTVGLAGASAGLVGFARAGLQGTVQGEQLRLRMQLLSQQVASVFLPTLDKLSAGLDTLTAKFRAMDGAQQAQVRRWGEAALAAGATAKAVGHIHPLAGLAAGGITALFVGTEKGRQSLQRMMEAAEPLAQKLAELAGPVMDKMTQSIEKMIPAVESAATKSLTAMDKILGKINEIDDAWARTQKRFTGKDLSIIGMMTQYLMGPVGWLGTIDNLMGKGPGGTSYKPLAGAARSDVSPMGGQVTGVEEVWRRIQASVGQAGASSRQEQQAKHIEEINRKLDNWPQQFKDTLTQVLDWFVMKAREAWRELRGHFPWGG